MPRALSIQLALCVRNHGRGYLTLKYLGFNATGFAGELAVARTDCSDMLLDTKNPLYVKAGLVTCALQHLHKALGWIVPPTEGQRTDRRIHDVASCLYGLHQRNHSYAGGRMRVNMNQRVVPALLLYPLNQFVRGLRFKETSAISYTD